MDFNDEFEFGKKLIVEAGDFVLSKFGSVPTSPSMKDMRNVVTEVDIQTEELIKTKIIEQFPAHGFIGEETDSLKSESFWVIDPIDGTNAFARNIEEWGSAIAFVYKNEIIFGLQYIPYTMELFSSYKGNGTFKNEHKVSLSKIENITNAIVSISHKGIWDPIYSGYSINLIKNTHLFRVGASNVVDCSYFLDGKIDIMVRLDKNLWDFVPQYILMKEAGAVVTDMQGKELIISFNKNDRVSYVATNSLISENDKDILYVKS